MVWPTKVNLTFDTVPDGRTLYLDGIAKTAPFVYDTLVGFNHTIEARNQTAGSTSYTFASWSDGGGQQHTITVPSTAPSYTATFNATPLPTGWWAPGGSMRAPGRGWTTRRGVGTRARVGAGATWTTAGKYGGALSFNGSSGNVTVPHSARSV